MVCKRIGATSQLNLTRRERNEIEKIERIACRLPLKQPFVTSYGQLTEKLLIFIW